ncbi:MAG: IS1182 family transposase [Candidatus Aminicenantes bacterium]|nr:IS1182 family transposase [Candidatus Aminicenantes bacterium]
MAYKIGNKMQQTFLPNTIDDYVSPQDPVRVYDAFVDALDFHSLGIPTEPQPGADEYYPKEMLKLIIYGYSYGTRSSRKLERACHHNLSFIWLMGDLKPDYRTIARFRTDHKEAIKRVLKQCVRTCIDLSLIEGNTLFVDGSKFRANASINNTWTREKCQQYLENIDKHIDQLLDECQRLDIQEDKQESMVKLKQEIQDKEKLVTKIKGVIDTLNKSKKTSINTTDPDCVKAKGYQGTHASYNVQMAVDEKHGLIVSAQASSCNNDRNQLNDQIVKSSENLTQKPKNVCSDSGYHSMPDLDKVDKDIQLILPSQKQAQKENSRHPLRSFDKERFQYDAKKDEYICPEGKPLKYIGIAFSNPRKKAYRANKQTCQSCSHFGICTKSKRGRIVTRLTEEEFKEHLEEVYKSQEGQEIYKLRKQKSELPFGHFKQNLGAGQFMLRGKSKVNAETSILSTCFNIARMITIIGVTELILKLNSG